MQLTKDADKLACLIYKKYLDRRKSGKTKAQAKSFEFNFHKEIDALSNWIEDDIYETVSELSHANLIKLYTDGGFYMLDSFIIYMENRFKNGALEVADFIAKFIP